MSVRCLIVDDNRDFLRAASDLLAGAGITVVGVASTGAQAGRACGLLQPDVVLVDLDLGGESGLEVASQLAGRIGPGRPRVIVISVDSAEDVDEVLPDIPAVSFLPKAALSGPVVLGLVGREGPPGQAP